MQNSNIFKNTSVTWFQSHLKNRVQVFSKKNNFLYYGVYANA